MVTLNGWQRLWVVIAVLWLPLAGQAVVRVGTTEMWWTKLVVGVAVWAIPLLVLYGVGLVVAWVLIPAMMNARSGHHERRFRASRSLIGAKRRMIGAA
jgi:hypothetical protein